MKRILVFALCIITLLITGCDKKSYEQDLDVGELCHCNKIDNCECGGMYQTVDSEQAKNLIYNGNTFLIDVRSKAEYNGGHIEGAISVPLDEIEEIELAKNINLIVYCKSGSRSKNAALKLLELGYVNVYDLGSMNNWK